MKILSSVLFGIKTALIVAIIGGVLAFLGAPVFFGLVIITSSVVMTVCAYVIASFVISALLHYYNKVVAERSQNGDSKDSTH